MYRGTLCVECFCWTYGNAFILFTSGTSDKPRAVVTTNYARANSGLQQGNDIRTTSNDRFCITMPIFHCFCLSANIMAALFYGACICIPNSHHTKDILETIQREKCTVLSSVPALFDAIISKNHLIDYDISSLRVGLIGGSSYFGSLFYEIENSFGLTLLASLP